MVSGYDCSNKDGHSCWYKEELEHDSEAAEEMAFCTGKVTEATCVSVVAGGLLRIRKQFGGIELGDVHRFGH